MGDSVMATTPEMMTAPASVNANSRNSAPVSPPWSATGVYTAASVMVHGDDRTQQLAGSVDRGLERRLAQVHVPLDVSPP